MVMEDSLFWADQLAKQVLDRAKKEKQDGISSGIPVIRTAQTPSGGKHIGNLNDVLRAHFVYKSLKDKGHKVRFVHTHDDRDPMKDVPGRLADLDAKWHNTQEFPELKNKPLFIAGLMLYWAEGDNGKAGSNVRLTNIDPRMIKVFINFALSLCKVPKENIRIGLLIYPDLNENICKNFWSKYTSVPVNQFHKIQVIKGRHPTKRLEYGICIVRVGGGGLKEKIRTWIDLYSRELMRV